VLNGDEPVATQLVAFAEGCEDLTKTRFRRAVAAAVGEWRPDGELEAAVFDRLLTIGRRLRIGDLLPRLRELLVRVTLSEPEPADYWLRESLHMVVLTVEALATCDGGEDTCDARSLMRDLAYESGLPATCLPILMVGVLRTAREADRATLIRDFVGRLHAQRERIFTGNTYGVFLCTLVNRLGESWMAANLHHLAHGSEAARWFVTGLVAEKRHPLGYCYLDIENNGRRWYLYSDR
jgi:hypothetical protein